MTSFLSGTRVVSLTTGIAGPNAARMLANYGAEVLKIESRVGGLDAFRAYDGTPEAVSGTAAIATTSAVNALRFKFSSGNIASGAVYAYGVAKS